MESHETKDVPGASEAMASSHETEKSPEKTPVAAASHEPIKTESGQAAKTTAEDVAQSGEAKPMSKNALKRIRRQQEWEDGREDRRKRRREKRHDRKERVREERAVLLAQGADPADVIPRLKQHQQRAGASRVPVALIVDCDFERYMTDKELISLASQVTRCYSDNRNARYRAHLWVAGWAGKLRERFRSALHDQQRHWKGVGFVEGDFLACADEARKQLADKPGDVIASLQRGDGEGDGQAAWTRDEPGAEPYPLPEPAPEPNQAYRDVVYLTSESPYTLQRLEPNTSYVIGGLVDKNREKGLCYRRACERGIRTARLPIGQFMQMQSRQVLATNHVVDIMLKWLEFEDWGKAFMAVIPKRKGGKLIGDGDDATEAEAHADDVEEEQVVADETMADQDAAVEEEKSESEEVAQSSGEKSS
ncbi:tRNA (guanine(9)-N1)-methyltransferase [Hirsutella minnesotensis 3608]|uniref:tRNA (guanine(9)-N1)-methyltransferase n=1 Tax=Hirsutella minnesotensis 3608 TaxID=1043627 RepID=A0A0F7ZQ72_9HYPO|nr:tRNA (guanine(9)-N1)-methyltransferase [Hirsutella minnesotensis 3608]